MLRFPVAAITALLLALCATGAAAQSTTQNSGRDSLLNGALIGVAAGVGSMAALDAVFCDNGFGGCETPWKGYLTLGGVGAAAGAGIDVLTGRKANGRPGALRLSPIIGPAAKGVRASLRLPQPGALPPLMKAQERASAQKRDSIWNGVLIGAGAGAAGGAIWGWQTCGSNDSECFAIAGPVGTIVGAGIGAAVGAVADALTR